jgi:hypothetical protein
MVTKACTDKPVFSFAQKSKLENLRIRHARVGASSGCQLRVGRRSCAAQKKFAPTFVVVARVPSNVELVYLRPRLVAFVAAFFLLVSPVAPCLLFLSTCLLFLVALLLQQRLRSFRRIASAFRRSILRPYRPTYSESPQSISVISLQITSTPPRPRCSATAFCCAESWTVRCSSIPCFARCVLNSLLIYSPPLSERSFLILTLYCVSHQASKIRNASRYHPYASTGIRELLRPVVGERSEA